MRPAAVSDCGAVPGGVPFSRGVRLRQDDAPAECRAEPRPDPEVLLTMAQLRPGGGVLDLEAVLP
jgi:hypothetical protein